MKTFPKSCHVGTDVLDFRGTWMKIMKYFAARKYVVTHTLRMAALDTW